jgi:hypothetical protein
LCSGFNILQNFILLGSFLQLEFKGHLEFHELNLMLVLALESE